MPSKTHQMILQSLDQAKGDLKKTRRLVKIALENDPDLLFDIVSPFIDGIIAHAVQRVAKGKTIGSTQPSAKPMEKVSQPPKAAARHKGGQGKAPAGGDLSKDNMNALLSHLSKSVGTPQGMVSKHKKASKRHLEAMNKLAKASFVSKK